ncbi:hypothetical protein ACFL08_00140 [Patescibacteria group bacterium]
MKIKNKFKGLFFGILGAILLSPSVSFAQWGTGKSAASGAGLPSGGVSEIVTNVMNWILGLVGVFGIIGFAIAGIWYLTAAGDDSKMEKGKNSMIWSIIGVIVALMGFVIIQAVDNLLNASAGF